MNNPRYCGFALTFAAVVAILVATAIVKPVPALAAACCQDCEASETACYAGCAAVPHDVDAEDSLSACYAECEDELYNHAYSCWAHCYYCSPAPQASCYQYYTFHDESWTCDSSGVNCTLRHTHRVMGYQVAPE
jgi:hypothetical protein